MNAQFVTTYAETEAWLKSLDIQNYTINADLSVDVQGSVFIQGKQLYYIPVQFGHVAGNFNCSDNGLTSLKQLAIIYFVKGIL